MEKNVEILDTKFPHPIIFYELNGKCNIHIFSPYN